MAQGDRARAPMVDQGLRVRPLGGARRRVAGVADRDLAVQTAHLLLVEDLRDEAHVAEDGQIPSVRDGDPADSWPRCWSACSPKCASRATSRSGAQIPSTPHISRALRGHHARLRGALVAGRRAGDRRRRHRARAAAPRRAARRPPGAQAITAWPPPSPNRCRRRRPARARRRRRSRSPPRRARPPALPRRRRARATGGARSARGSRRAGPPRPGRGSAGLPPDLAVERLVLGAGERQRRRAREQDDVSLPPARRHGANVGYEPDAADHRRRVDRRARRSRCRARRFPRRRGCSSASAASAIPSIASASCQAISPFSGLPKLRQSVSPSGSPPAQATFRAASSTASAPPVARADAGEPPAAVERDGESARATGAGAGRPRRARAGGPCASRPGGRSARRSTPGCGCSARRAGRAAPASSTGPTGAGGSGTAAARDGLDAIAGRLLGQEVARRSPRAARRRERPQLARCR